MAAEYADAFDATRVENVFCPIHVVDVNDQYIDPLKLTARLPGALIKVFFTLRYWNFKDKQYNSFSAGVVQVQILRAPQAASTSIGKRLVARAGARMISSVQSGDKRASSPDTGSSKKAKLDAAAIEGEQPMMCRSRGRDGSLRSTLPAAPRRH